MLFRGLQTRAQMETKAFIDQKAFFKLIEEIPNTEGQPYQDVDTIYRDMSRLVVAWLANTKSTDLHRTYAEGGWRGTANVRAIRECAKTWLQRYHPDFPRSKD